MANAKRILIVDDMVVMRKAVRKCLVELGFPLVTEAGDGEAAWSEIQAAIQRGQPFDLVISDWTMPHLKGIDLLKRVRSSESTRELPFILLTGEAEKDLVLEAISAGVSCYITKPFSVATLSEKLKKVPTFC